MYKTYHLVEKINGEKLCERLLVNVGIEHSFQSAPRLTADISYSGFDGSRDGQRQILPKRVIFNPPATIVFWSDGTKTVVKVHDELYSREKGILNAYWKKTCGLTPTQASNLLKSLCEDEEET